MREKQITGLKRLKENKFEIYHNTENVLKLKACRLMMLRYYKRSAF